MKRIYSAIIMLLFCASQTFSQDLSKFGDGTAENPYVQKGQFSMGIRQTTSLFGHDKIPGLGVGGQMRWQIFDYLSTEWFTDWITIDLDGAGTRNNAHIGWSVMFYPTRKGRVIPYAIAGHCFDFAKVIPLSNEYLDRSGDVITRWSSAIQAGLGSHFYLTDRFEISLSAQYMLHLGDHLDYELTNTPSGSYLETQEHTTGQAATEGHLLISASMNFKIADLW
jgi:hypothetical protein